MNNENGQSAEQRKYDFLYELYADCVAVPELIKVAQMGVGDDIERRAVCENLVGTVTEDACHLTDDDIHAIYAVAMAGISASQDEEENAHWEKLKTACIDEMETRKEDHVCENCGGDLREGDHEIQVAVDDFVCRADTYSRSDYAFESFFDR